MKKLIAILIAGSAAVAAQAQTDIRSLADSIQVSVTYTDTNQVWQVTVPNQVAAALAGARKQGETDIDYAKRAFFYGATGLEKERRFIAAEVITLSNRLAQAQAKMAYDIAVANTNAAALSNQLQVIKAKIQ